MLDEHGKLDAFEEVAMPHINDLYRTACRVVGDRTEAHDLVQEAYLQAWKSFHRFQLGTNCRAWLFKILFHVIRNYQRKWYRLRRHVATDVEETLEELASYEPVVLDRLCEAEILKAFDAIPQHYREVVHLVDVEELSYKEAADSLDIPIGTVMSRLSRGRGLIRQELRRVNSSRQRPADSTLAAASA